MSRARSSAPQSSNFGSDYRLVGAICDFVIKRRTLILPTLSTKHMYILFTNVCQAEAMFAEPIHPIQVLSATPPEVEF